MFINDNLKLQIKEHALREYPKECCGLIISSGDKLLTYSCKNISSNPLIHFELSPLDYIRAYDQGKNKIIGVYHSQENDNLSSLDILNSTNHKYYSIVYSYKNDRFFEITDKHFKYKKYLGKEFYIGKQDCFSLIQEFYKNEYNIIINDYKRNDDWYTINPNIIIENYKKEGFIETTKENLQEGDIILFRFKHFGIYLNNNLLLHHRRSTFSTIEMLNKFWFDLITNCYRYNE